MKSALKRWTDGFIHLLVYHRCVVCRTELAQSEHEICTTCRGNMPYTYFENSQEPTPLDQLFFGRVQLASTFALLSYDKTSPYKELVRSLKYANKPHLGILLGEEIGQRIQERLHALEIDYIVPLPLHPKKQQQRGYNQSEQLAIGLSEATQIPVLNNWLVRHSHGSSQTRLGRFTRWDNVQERFELSGPLPTNARHLVIIDDVITTGATLETVVNLIQKTVPEVKISLIGLALAN